MMKTPSVNLARRPFRNNTVYYAVFGSCFALLVAASGYNVYHFARTGNEIDRLYLELGTSTQRYQELSGEVEKMKVDVGRVDLKTLNAKSNFANGLILSRLFSWSSLFDRIEEMIPPEVKIRSIRPSITPKAIEIQIDGLARTPDALYEFETALDESGYFSGVYPVSESSRESKTELNFDILMSYIQAGKSTSAPGISTLQTAAPPEPEPPAGQSAQQAATGEEQGAPEALPVSAPQGSALVPPAPSASAPAAPAAVAQAPPVPQPAVQRPARPGAQAGAQAEGGGEQTAAEPVPAPPPAQSAGKRPREMTNKEIVDSFGQGRFIRMRGGFTPKEGPDAAVTNEEYIKQHGLEGFLKARGPMDFASQTPPARPGAPDPNGAKP
jgi:hypothetical protein